MSHTGKPIKCVIVGDGCVDKTRMLISYTTGTIPEKRPPPTVWDRHSVRSYVDGIHVNLDVLDTSGQDEYDRLRPIAYPKTDVILLCFSIAGVDSFENAGDKWIPEIRHYCPNAPIILVGTKVDQRSHCPSSCITECQGLKLARKIKAVKYIECSADTQVGVRQVFDEAVRTVLRAYGCSQSSTREHKECVLM